MEKERHVLVVFPHPDDEAFGVSGTIAYHVQKGTPVTYACLTLGEMGRNLGNPPFATRESLATIRKKELMASAKALGIQDLRMLGFRDKTIEFEDEKTLTDLIYKMILELNPSLVITFYPGYSVHPDHDATGRAVVSAVGRLPKELRPKLYCVAFSNNCEKELGSPDVIIDVSAFAEQKLATIRAHKTQTALFYDEFSKKLNKKDPDAFKWLHYERFWSYKWTD
ncbi:bacillithiol biosynthesis deacetylase BshB2 [Fervidibacillus halotolerans]|uniref:Bacillithiol biosynthesis deacetylase BshB2 n=1 Tax=Fervidibacillus halotolerans TaxID=2980027 RepID=A0A9E8LZF0_9BACI|nr:bacillithiol biosynthesis deacetylase BshB2 [Fervidibacillus halotolerans]WAA12232.1 bacillithiol biosynthesis deacetylase BshB2 [Fervidibacillus halotolerans]